MRLFARTEQYIGVQAGPLVRAVAAWLLAWVVCAAAGCAAPPELLAPTGQSKTPFSAPNASTATPTPTVLAHDAADIAALSEALDQLREHIAQVQSSGPAVRPTPSGMIKASDRPSTKRPINSATAPTASTPATGAGPASGTAPQGLIQVNPATVSRQFTVLPSDTSVVAVLLRWCVQQGWQLRLNEAVVLPQQFPAHAVAYGDLHLVPMAQGIGADQLEQGVALLMQAHTHFQDRLDLRVAVVPDAKELVVSAQRIHPVAMTAAFPSDLVTATTTDPAQRVE